MELKLKKQPAAVCEPLLDAAAEHPIECDILLPDYCPDIVRVLTCRAQADVTDCAVRGAALTVEGMTTVTLCYLGDVGGVHTTQVRQPFSKSFELSEEAISPIVFASAERGYLTCRASSRRRVDVRGVLSVSAMVCDARTEEVVIGAQSGVCLKTEEYRAACLRARTLQRFSQREEVSPPPGTHVPHEVLRADCCAVVQEWRPVSNGILLKGDLIGSMLWSAGEENELETAQYTLPMSRVLEISEPASVCDVSVRCTAVDCAPAEDAQEDRLSLELQLEAAVLSCSETQLEAAKDAFSTQYISRCDAVNLRTACVRASVRERTSVRAQIPLPPDASEVTDVFAALSQTACSVSEGQLVLSGRAALAAVVSGAEGGPEAVSETALLSVPLYEAGEERIVCRPQVSVLSAQGTIEDGTLTLTAELLITGAVLAFPETAALRDVLVDETSPIERDPSVGLVIRYADAGESVWDIARQYGAQPSRILDDNGLTEDLLSENTVLVIPGA